METFETFEALYNKAIFYGEIEPAEGNHSKVVKDALNSINQTFYEREFWIWLQNKKEFNPEKGSIQPFLTEENWIEFFREHTKQAEAAHADYLNKQADRKRRIDSEEPSIENQVPQMPLVPPVEIPKKKFKAIDHVLAYQLDCFAKGKIPLKVNEKKKLETEGELRIGEGKGHRFYREFGRIEREYPSLDYNSALDLLNIWGENWRNAVLNLSDDADLLDNYLKSKDL